jgi:hypothetical protein
MVDIIIGSVPPVAPPVNKPATNNSRAIEAEILNIRTPRQRVNRREGEEERRRQFRQDPAGGRILTILVANSSLLPHDIKPGKYKIRLNFVKK